MIPASLGYYEGGYIEYARHINPNVFGYHAVENKVSVPDLHATILHLLGMDHKKLT